MDDSCASEWETRAQTTYVIRRCHLTNALERKAARLDFASAFASLSTTMDRRRLMVNADPTLADDKKSNIART